MSYNEPNIVLGGVDTAVTSPCPYGTLHFLL